jgi:hypothetical protein
MEKEFTPYQEALELKELGFDETCFGYYVDGELRGINLGMEELGGVEPYYQRLGFHTLSNHDIDNPNKIVATAPTYSQAFRWFREKHILDCYIDRGGAKGVYYAFVGGSEHGFLYGNNGNSPSEFTYEEAELECLIKLIQIVKNKGGDK